MEKNLKKDVCVCVCVCLGYPAGTCGKESAC